VVNTNHPIINPNKIKIAVKKREDILKLKEMKIGKEPKKNSSMIELGRRNENEISGIVYEKEVNHSMHIPKASLKANKNDLKALKEKIDNKEII